jgi:hypothetical protein
MTRTSVGAIRALQIQILVIVWKKINTQQKKKLATIEQ